MSVSRCSCWSSANIVVMLLFATTVLTQFVAALPHVQNPSDLDKNWIDVEENHRRLMKAAMIEEFKDNILSRLGLSSPPEVSKEELNNVTQLEQRRVLRDYRRSVEQLQHQAPHVIFDNDALTANNFFSFNDRGTTTADSQPMDAYATGSKRVYFKLQIPDPVENDVTNVPVSAKLNLFKNPAFVSNTSYLLGVGHLVLVNVYQVMILEEAAHSSNMSKTSYTRQLVTSRSIQLFESGWEEFDVTVSVAQWMRDPASNLGFEVMVLESISGKLLHNAFVTRGSVDHGLGPSEASLHRELPRLNVIVRQQQQQQHRRDRRAIISKDGVSIGTHAPTERADCVEGDGETRCCRYSLWLSFAEIGWDDWVIAPKGFQAYYCKGRCPSRYKSAHNFASIKSLLHAFNPGRLPAPVCSATKLSPFALAHYKDGHLVVSSWSDMIIEECKCV